MKTFLISAAVIVAASAASAQDAYVTQLGNNLTGVNYSEYNIASNSGTNTQQVIAQQGIGFAAANLSRGTGNSATTFQLDTTNTFVNDGNASGATAESLIWQKADGYTNGYNQAVAVQLVVQGPGAEKAAFRSQIIQEGNNNTAVNWQQTNGGPMAGLSLAGGGLSAPALTLTPNATARPTPAANVNFPYGSNIFIN
ncbi:hypothetical protein [Sulfitobacter sp. S190]|uniref:hypothetical protein n=1 Tax=Sulfitobacter sp. S190 TaxID=2867022 RepID=UPI0021A313DF|nr:hypothetical protein [Sulfitobacter sp. S190]UWR23338.1 hypothetical protein K3756_04930 [Sulfitobacter sp. S190]